MFSGHSEISRPSGQSKESWQDYTCGHCGTDVTGAVVAHYATHDKRDVFIQNKWVLCQNCCRGSVIVVIRGLGKQHPGNPFGPVLKGLPAEIEEAYNEVRN